MPKKKIKARRVTRKKSIFSRFHPLKALFAVVVLSALGTALFVGINNNKNVLGTSTNSCVSQGGTCYGGYSCGNGQTMIGNGPNSVCSTGVCCKTNPTPKKLPTPTKTPITLKAPIAFKLISATNGNGNLFDQCYVPTDFNQDYIASPHVVLTWGVSSNASSYTIHWKYSTDSRYNDIPLILSKFQKTNTWGDGTMLALGQGMEDGYLKNISAWFKTPSQISYLVKGLMPSKTIKWYVTANNSSGSTSTPVSSIATPSTTCRVAALVVKLTTVCDQGYPSIKATWKAIPDATLYVPMIVSKIAGEEMWSEEGTLKTSILINPSLIENYDTNDLIQKVGVYPDFYGHDYIYNSNSDVILSYYKSLAYTTVPAYPKCKTSGTGGL